MSPLSLEQLEARTTPATWHGGEVWIRDHSEQPFADWHGELQTFDAGQLRYIVAGNGAGPRVAVFDLTTGTRDRPDYWAGDPASRAGVVLVPTIPAAIAATPPPSSAAVTFDGSTGYRVYLDFRPDDGPQFVRDAAATVAELLGHLVTITTERPDDYPAHYGSAIYGASLGYAAAPDRPAGIAPADWTDGRASWWDAEPVYVDARYTPTAADAGRMLAHEIGHALGVDHADGEPWDRLDLVDAGARAAATYRVSLPPRIAV